MTGLHFGTRHARRFMANSPSMSEENTNIENDQWTIRGGEPLDYPGCWVVTGTNANSGGSWSILRKEDGTYWEITAEHFFPPTGGTLRVELGNQITDPDKLVKLREFYLAYLENQHSKKAANG